MGLSETYLSQTGSVHPTPSRPNNFLTNVRAPLALALGLLLTNCTTDSGLDNEVNSELNTQTEPTPIPTTETGDNIENTPSPSPTAITDLDQDGSPSSLDCNDSNPDQFPGNTELCDEIDNDCDGEVDNSAENSLVVYTDSDGDGHGDPNSRVLTCSKQIDGLVDTAGDCDDTNPAIHPGSQDIPYDNEDSDCNPLTDGDDLDGDGFPKDNDCNDSDASMNPITEELCDAKDNNCDGVVDNEAQTIQLSDFANIEEALASVDNQQCLHLVIGNPHYLTTPSTYLDRQQTVLECQNGAKISGSLPLDLSEIVEDDNGVKSLTVKFSSGHESCDFTTKGNCNLVKVIALDSQGKELELRQVSSENELTEGTYLSTNNLDDTGTIGSPNYKVVTPIDEELRLAFKLPDGFELQKLSAIPDLGEGEIAGGILMTASNTNIVGCEIHHLGYGVLAISYGEEYLSGLRISNLNIKDTTKYGIYADRTSIEIDGNISPAIETWNSHGLIQNNCVLAGNLTIKVNSSGSASSLSVYHNTVANGGIFIHDFQEDTKLDAWNNLSRDPGLFIAEVGTIAGNQYFTNGTANYEQDLSNLGGNGQTTDWIEFGENCQPNTNPGKANVGTQVGQKPLPSRDLFGLELDWTKVNVGAVQVN